jgi:hypothetical protein
MRSGIRRKTRPRALLVEDVAAETADAAQAEGQVQLPCLLEFLLLDVREDAVRERLDDVGREVRVLSVVRWPSTRPVAATHGKVKVDPPSSWVALSKSGRFIAFDMTVRLHGFSYDFVQRRHAVSHFHQTAQAQRRHAFLDGLRRSSLMGALWMIRSRRDSELP